MCVCVCVCALSILISVLLLHFTFKDSVLLYPSSVKASEELTKSKSDRRQDPDEDDVLDDTTDEPGGPSLLKSDAVLSCPACMSTLCLDCQRLGTPCVHTCACANVLHHCTHYPWLFVCEN